MTYGERPQGSLGREGIGRCRDTEGPNLRPGVKTSPRKEAGRSEISRDPNEAQWNAGPAYH